MATPDTVLVQDEYNRFKIIDLSKRQPIQKLSRVQQPFGGGDLMAFGEAVRTAGALSKHLFYGSLDNSLQSITDSAGIINWLAFRINGIISSSMHTSKHYFHLVIDDKEVITNTFYSTGSQFVLIGSAVVLPKGFATPGTPSSPELQPDTAIITFQPIKFYESIKFGITSQNSIDVEVAYNAEEYIYE